MNVEEFLKFLNNCSKPELVELAMRQWELINALREHTDLLKIKSKLTDELVETLKLFERGNQ